MNLDELVDAGCAVSINSHPENGHSLRWCVMLGDYMTPRWPQVSESGPTIEMAVELATAKALAAHKPDEAPYAVIVVDLT